MYESTYGFGQAHFQNVARVCRRLQIHESLYVHPKVTKRHQIKSTAKVATACHEHQPIYFQSTVSAKHVETLLDGAIARRAMLLTISRALAHATSKCRNCCVSNDTHVASITRSQYTMLVEVSAQKVKCGVVRYLRDAARLEHSPRLPAQRHPPCWLVDKRLHISLISRILR